MKTLKVIAIVSALAACIPPLSGQGVPDDGTDGKVVGERLDCSATPLLVLTATNCVLFVGGRYIAPDYRIEAFKYSVTVNGTVIRSNPLERPFVEPDPKDYSALPEVPPTVTEKSSCDDEEVRKYMEESFLFCWFHSVTNKAELAAHAIRRLPCVVDAWPVSDVDVGIKWRNDDVPVDLFRYCLRPRWACTRKPVPVEERCRGRAEYCANSLNQGGFWLIPSQTSRPELHSVYPEQIFPLLVSLLDTETTGRAIAEKIKAKTGRRLDVEFCDSVLAHKDELTPSDRERLKSLKKK